MRLLTILATFVTTSALAQPQISWQKYFGNQTTNTSWVNSIIQLHDSGFFCFARLNGTTVKNDLFLTDKYGDTLWTKNAGFYGQLLNTLDAGFALFGPDIGGGRLQKIDSNYNFTWSQSYPTISYGGVATQCSDSCYVLAGANWIIKTDPLGNVVWQHNTSGGFASVMECNNGDILAVGAKSYCKYWATLLDSTGTLKWERQYSDFTISGGDAFYLRGAVQLPDSNFIVVANNNKNSFYASCGGFDVAKIDKDNGDTIWTKQYPTIYPHTLRAAISQLKDNYIFLTFDGLLAKSDINGSLIWSLPTNFDDIYSVTACSDGGAAIAGYNFQLTAQYLATYAKTDSLGNIYNFQGIPSIAVNELRVYPNPAFNELAINSEQLANGQEVTLTIYDMLGKVQLQQTFIPQGDFNVDVKGLSSGLYMLQLKQEDRLFNGRFVKE